MTGLAFDGTTGIVNATWTTLTRPGTAVAGQSGYNTDTGAFETFNGSTWGYTTGTWNTAGRPTNPVAGLTGFNTTYGGFEVWNGTAWSTISGGPAFSAYGTALQSLPDVTTTLIQFNTIITDTNSNYSTTGYRFTPTVAGYYQVNMACIFKTSATAGICNIVILKNGTTGVCQSATALTAVLNTSVIPSTSGVVYLNGSTDYLEGYGYQNSGSALLGGSSDVSTQFSAAFIRGV